MIEAIASWDAQVMLFVQEHLRVEAFDPIVRFITALGNAGIFWIILGLALFIYKPTRRDSAFCLPTLAIATIINNLILKRIIMRVRPYDVIEGLTIIIERENSWSFPSGHACSSFTMAAALFFAFRGRGGGWAYIPAVLIAASRVYVGVHYPTDIIAAAAVGTTVAVICYFQYQKIRSRYPGKLA